MTNRQFLSDPKASARFRRACKSTGFEPTVRQAAKWRKKTGLVWKYRDVDVKKFKENIKKAGYSASQVAKALCNFANATVKVIE